VPTLRSPLRVALVMRRPLPGQFSVERVFRDVASAFPPDIEASLVEVPCPSRGLFPRIRNVLFTARLQADIIHITGDVQYCALAVRPSRCILTILDLVSLRRLIGWRRCILSLVWYRLPVLRAGAVTTISSAVRDELLRILPTAAHKTTVIGCPVGDSFQPASNGACDRSEFCVLQVGAGPNKNLERVAAALQGLPVHFHVVGRITDEQRRLMDLLGLSYSQDTDLSDGEMQIAYQRSGLLVFASTYEGFGLPILEAQACGIPVVTSAIPPMCDIAGGAAVLVDPYDPASIRRGIETVLDDSELRSRLSASGRLNASRHTAAAIAAQYADTYRRLGIRHSRPSGPDGEEP
jgi:glycosyltransferase involved in cell wall biosynthesis